MDNTLTVGGFFAEVESLQTELETRMARLRTLFAHHKAGESLTDGAPEAWNNVENAYSAMADRLTEFSIYGDPGLETIDCDICGKTIYVCDAHVTPDEEQTVCIDCFGKGE